MDPLVLTVLVAVFSLAALVFVMALVAARADHQVTIRGPMATLEELNRQIDTKRETLVDLDEDLNRRRDALANVAGIQAEVDALIRQRDELLTEHGQLEDRRQEVLALRRETEEAAARHADVTRNLTEKAAELENVQTELSEGRRLVAEIDSLTESHETLSERVSQLRTDVVALEALLGQEDSLRRRLPELEREATRLDAEIEARRSQREHAEAAAQSAEERLGALRTDLVEAAAASAVARQKNDESEDKIEGLQQRRAELEAQVAHLEEKFNEHPKDAPPSDPLAELRTLPPVLVDLGHRQEQAEETEADALERARRHLEALGLSYPQRVVHAFHTAMKVNETTQMAVLAGISGTGKSQLPRRYAEAMGIAFLHVPVQPRWDSPQDLMGFYNYIESRFRPTDMARALYHMDAWNGPEDSRSLQNRMLLILLDEMNLARVEYYFSDFLSRLESRPGREQAAEGAMRKDAEIELDIPVPEGQQTPRIFPGYNVLFVGTMNEDESTQSLSDKVVDRANVLRFAAPRAIAATTANGDRANSRAVSRDHWEKWLRDISDLGSDDQHEVMEHVNRILELMRRLGRPIGFRLGQAIMAYVSNYPQHSGLRDNRTPLADQVEMRILPKLRGVEIDSAQGDLDQLRRYVEEDLDDSHLAEAISDSIKAARSTGQFVWRGVTRG